MILILSVWVLSFNHITQTSDELHEALLDVNSRNKEMTDAHISADAMPSPIDANGAISNAGMATLTNLKLYTLSGSIVENNISSNLGMDMVAEYSLGSVEYGDQMLLVSDQDFWGLEVVPIEAREDAVLNNIVEGSQVSMAQIFQTPYNALFPLGSNNATLKEDVAVQNDNRTVVMSKQDDHEYEWYVGSCSHSPSSQLVIWARQVGDKVPKAIIQAWDGLQFNDAYTCEWASNSSVPCQTENLADELSEDDGWMRIRIIPDRATDYAEYDYVILDVICIL